MRPIQTRIALTTGLLLALPAAHANDAAALAKDLSNPVAALISVPLQSNWEQNIGPDDRGSRYTLNLQPVIPISIGEDWNLISRTILPVVDQWGIVPAPTVSSASRIRCRASSSRPRRRPPAG